MSGKPGCSGRPSAYTPELAQIIIEQTSDGRYLKDICAAEGMPTPTTVRRWVLADVHGFKLLYAQACELRAEAMAEDMYDVACSEPRMTTNKMTGETKIDPGFETWRKNKLDAMKWIASKVLPKQYGDKPIELHVHTDAQRLTDDDLARIALQGKTIDGTATIIGQKVIAA